MSAIFRAHLVINSLYAAVSSSLSHTHIPIPAGLSARRKDSLATTAGAWGLLRNGFQEFPSVKWTGADVSPLHPGAGPSVNIAVPLTADAFGAALDARAWHTPRMLPEAVPSASTRQGSSLGGSLRGSLGGYPLVPGRAWLVTGGLGGLGRLHATWLASEGARAVLLADVDVRRLPGELTGEGCITCVTARLADVACAADLAGCLQTRDTAQLSGILHAAGVLRVRACSSNAVSVGSAKWRASCVKLSSVVYHLSLTFLHY
jgi:hypothetical protein